MKGERKRAPLKRTLVICFVFASQCVHSLVFANVEAEESVQSALGELVANFGCL